MNLKEKKESLLEQLNKATGINFSILDSELSDVKTIDKLGEMVKRLNALDSKESFYKAFFTGDLSYDETSEYIHRLHINDEIIRMLFYLEAANEYNKDALSLLKSLLPNSDDTLIEIDPSHVVIIMHFDKKPSSDELYKYCKEFLDMLETEAFVSCKVSYDIPSTSLKSLPCSFQNCVLAMQIGNIFNSNEHIYSYETLGLGRLLYNIPAAEVDTYLNNHINTDIFSTLDEGTLNILETFFNNDLSIAETSRKMFIHRNTLIYRLDKFADLTGYDVRKFSDAITVKLSLMLYSYIKTIQNKKLV